MFKMAIKVQLYASTGEKRSEITLPSLFSSTIREDLAKKYFDIVRFLAMHPYAPSPEAGRRHSASGTIGHRRHQWGGHYGKGISRIPRKTMSRSGANFNWVGAEVSGTRGGRAVHGPTLIKAYKKINKKEAKIAMLSALAATANKNIIIKRYSSLSELNIPVPLVFESKIDNTKAKPFLSTLEKVLGNLSGIAFKKKSVREGKGKRRGRKYKSTSGMLLIKSSDEKIKVPAIDVRSVKELSITDLYPLGRLTVFTEKSLTELSEYLSDNAQSKIKEEKQK